MPQCSRQMRVFTKFIFFTFHVLPKMIDGANRRVPFQRAKMVPAVSSSVVPENRITISNMTCHFVEQPLNHFDLPRGRSPTYKQRVCIYDEFVTSSMEKAPIFLYTGNESPLEIYINNTGLIWELAEQFGAQVVFMEHRYEGKSLPNPEIAACMAYSSSVQALADFAAYIETHLFRCSCDDPSVLKKRPVIAFGGSYGGMLSAWMRIKYPGLITGAIAASAPIWAFPLNFPDRIDEAWKVISTGLELPYPPTDVSSSIENHCGINLLASLPLVRFLGNDSRGQVLLTKAFQLCNPLHDHAEELIEWIKSPWFNFAEGSFPYPSGYIPYALTHNDMVMLPSWPLQAACWNVSHLYSDFGVEFIGNRTNVEYNVSYGDSGLTLSIDWDKVSASEGLDWEQIENSETIANLLTNVRDAVSVWYNMTQDIACYDLSDVVPDMPVKPDSLPYSTSESRSLRTEQEEPASEQCKRKMETEGSWVPMCCNEEMILINAEAQGLGNDYFWPPSHPRGTRTHADVLRADQDNNNNNTFDYCSDPDGIFGYPDSPQDPWSRWYDAIYGGTRIESHSNIIFSNGLLDPWSSGGVEINVDQAKQVGPGIYTRAFGAGMLSILMDYGGHHTDLMYASPEDPPGITIAREIERNMIEEWILEFWNT